MHIILSDFGEITRIIKAKVRLKKKIKYGLGWIHLLSFYAFSFSKIRASDIVFIFPYYHVGGAEQVHLNIVRALENKKVTIIFTHLSATDHFLSRFKEYATVIELNSIINKKSSRVTKLLFKTIAQAINSSKTVTHIFGCNTTYFYDILPLIDASKNRLDLVHAIAPNDPRVPMLAKSAHHLDTRVVINKKAKVDLLKIYDQYKIKITSGHFRVILNGVDLSGATNFIKNKDKDSFRINFLGRWSEEKRPWLFLEIARILQEKFVGLQLSMAGSGMKRHKEKIESASVKYLGEINNKNSLVEFYRDSDVLIICSISEGFPMVLMEGMPYGVIPVCTNVGGISEHIIHNENGILITNDTDNVVVARFIEELSKLILNKIEVERLSENATLYALKHFGIDNFNRSYKELFH